MILFFVTLYHNTVESRPANSRTKVLTILKIRGSQLKSAICSTKPQTILVSNTNTNAWISVCPSEQGLNNTSQHFCYVYDKINTKLLWELLNLVRKSHDLSTSESMDYGLIIRSFLPRS